MLYLGEQAEPENQADKAFKNIRALENEGIFLSVMAENGKDEYDPKRATVKTHAIEFHPDDYTALSNINDDGVPFIPDNKVSINDMNPDKIEEKTYSYRSYGQLFLPSNNPVRKEHHIVGEPGTDPREMAEAARQDEAGQLRPKSADSSGQNSAASENNAGMEDTPEPALPEQASSKK